MAKVKAKSLEFQECVIARARKSGEPTPVILKALGISLRTLRRREAKIRTAQEKAAANV